MRGAPEQRGVNVDGRGSRKEERREQERGGGRASAKTGEREREREETSRKRALTLSCPSPSAPESALRPPARARQQRRRRVSVCLPSNSTIMHNGGAAPAPSPARPLTCSPLFLSSQPPSARADSRRSSVAPPPRPLLPSPQTQCGSCHAMRQTWGSGKKRTMRIDGGAGRGGESTNFVELAPLAT